MKSFLTILLLTFSLACQSVNSTSQTKANVNTDIKSRSSQSVTLQDHGISFLLPVGWNKDETSDTDEGDSSWLGPNTLEL